MMGHFEHLRGGGCAVRGDAILNRAGDIAGEKEIHLAVIDAQDQ